MSVTLQIPESQKNFWIEHYKKRLKEIDNERLECLKMLEVLGVEVSIDKGLIEGQKDLSLIQWTKTIISILNREDKLLSTNDLYELFVNDYPKISEAKRKRVITKLSTTLSQLSRRDTVVSIDNPITKGNLWGLKSWFINKKIMPEYADKFQQHTGISIHQKNIHKYNDPPFLEE